MDGDSRQATVRDRSSYGLGCLPMVEGTDGEASPSMVTTDDARWLADHLRKMVSSRPAAWASTEMTLAQLLALHFISAKPVRRRPRELARLSWVDKVRRRSGPLVCLCCAMS